MFAMSFQELFECFFLNKHLELNCEQAMETTFARCMDRKSRRLESSFVTTWQIT